MDLLPSFSQPNVREQQPLISNAANFIAICSQSIYIRQFVGRMLIQENKLWGKSLTEGAKFLCCFKACFYTIKPLAI